MFNTGNLRAAISKAGLPATLHTPPRLSDVWRRSETATIYVTHWSLTVDKDGDVFAPDWTVTRDHCTRGGTLDCEVTVSPAGVHVNIPTNHLPRLRHDTPDPDMLKATSLSFNGRGY